MSFQHSSCDNNPAQLLIPKAVSSWKKTAKSFTLFAIPIKVTVLVLLWQFSTGLIYNLFLRPTGYIQFSYIKDATLFAVFTYAVFLFSPLAGFIADVKFGRIKMLLCGSYIMLLSVIFGLLVLIMVSLVHTYTFRLILLYLVGVTMVFYCIGDVVFLSNVIQFGTDQLRDAPTHYSVLFINAYFWINSFGNIITSITNWPGHEFFINSRHHLISFDKVKTALVTAVLSFSILASVVLLVFVHKKQRQWLLTESTRDNPYKLVHNVIRFAIHHKKPIRRSAFTYCEDERLSRLDFGKQRYGGPYTTEQVEDVKVALNMLKVLLSLGPAFLLEVGAVSSFLDHHVLNVTYHEVTNPLPILLIDYGMLLPLSTTVCIPLFHCVIKPLLSKHYPNMFKRMGIALGMLTISFLVYLMYDTLAYNGNYCFGHLYTLCWQNTSYIFNKSYFRFPSIYISVLQQILLSLCQILLYIPAYEFICCQSPQHMKGLLFGLFYAVRAFYQCLAEVAIFFFISYWDSIMVSYRSGFYMFNISIGIISLIIYTIVAKKCKYRKRDDICNIHLFAEEHYSNCIIHGHGIKYNF